MPAAVWKYQMPRFAIVSLEVPVGAEFLCVQIQHGEPVAWFRVDPTREKETLEFSWSLTGDPCPDIDDGIYRGSLLFHDGHIVMHLFQKPVQSAP